MRRRKRRRRGRKRRMRSKHKTILSCLGIERKLDNKWLQGEAESPPTAKILNAILAPREEHLLLKKPEFLYRK